MGGHGGLNILPQKRWNVYNYENREKVRRDEEAAAKEEQLEREAVRKRDAEFRIAQIRSARSLDPAIRGAAVPSDSGSESKSSHVINFEGGKGIAAGSGSESNSGHINLFEGLKVFDMVGGASADAKGVAANVQRDESAKKKKRKKEEEMPRVVTAEDEKYRLGYGIAGKGVKLPWYLARRDDDVGGRSSRDDGESRLLKEASKGGGGGKKSLEELREERITREKREKQRERVVIREATQRDRDGNQKSSRGVYRM